MNNKDQTIYESLINARPQVVEEVVESRWTMNYAAAIDDGAWRLLDTRQEKLQVHPMFLGHQEWDAIGNLLATTLLDGSQRARGVATHFSVKVHHPLEVGMKVSSVAQVKDVSAHRAGTRVSFHVVTQADGKDITETVHEIILRDVFLQGLQPGSRSTGRSAGIRKIICADHASLSATACHVFSACARSYNPIHTDLMVAETAGLPGLILHGAATMAKAVSYIGHGFCHGDFNRIKEINGAFRAMVRVPGIIKFVCGDVEEEGGWTRVAFEVLNGQGELAIQGGSVVFE